jgi:hypothetical protein
VFFARTHCPICRANHAWFAPEAWVDEPSIRVRRHSRASVASRRHGLRLGGTPWCECKSRLKRLRGCCRPRTFFTKHAG